MNASHINTHPADMQNHRASCAGLIEMTADALSGGVVALMLLAVQKDNLELNIKQAIKWKVPMLSRRRTR